jgi:hypothetical protein
MTSRICIVHVFKITIAWFHWVSRDLLCGNHVHPFDSPSTFWICIVHVFKITIAWFHWMSRDLLCGNHVYPFDSPSIFARLGLEKLCLQGSWWMVKWIIEIIPIIYFLKIAMLHRLALFITYSFACSTKTKSNFLVYLLITSFCIIVLRLNVSYIYELWDVNVSASKVVIWLDWISKIFLLIVSCYHILVSVLKCWNYALLVWSCTMLVGILVSATNHSSDHIGIACCDFYSIWFLLANAILWWFAITLVTVALFRDF